MAWRAAVNVHGHEAFNRHSVLKPIRSNKLERLRRLELEASADPTGFRGQRHARISGEPAAEPLRHQVRNSSLPVVLRASMSRWACAPSARG